MNEQQIPEKPYQPFVTRLGPYLQYVEKVFLVIITLSLVLGYSGVNAQSLGIIGFAGLAGVFFLSAYQPIKVEREGEEIGGFKKLLGLTIAPKVIGISCAVVIMGICFYYLGNPSYREMLLIGGPSLAAGVGGLWFSVGATNPGTVYPIFYRAIPLLIICIYLLIPK